MPYGLTDFMGVALPQAMPEDDLSTGAVNSTLSASIGGVYDVAGNARRWPGAHQFNHKGKYQAAEDGAGLVRVTTDGSTRVTSTAATRVLASVPLLELQLMTDTLKAMIGQRGALWRRRFYDNARSWKTCRLLEVRHVETVEEAGAVSEVESAYETSMNGWRAETATVATLGVSSGIATPLAVNNGGMLPVYDALLKVDRLGSTITQVRVTGSGTDITWTGAIPTSQSLTIDAGAQTVQLAPTAGGASTDAYSGFVLGASVSDWLPLTVGVNTLTITVTGGNANATVSFYPQWP